jgi:hypothetical protein
VRHSNCVYNEPKVQVFRKSTTGFGCKILVFLKRGFVREVARVWKNVFAP